MSTRRRADPFLPSGGSRGSPRTRLLDPRGTRATTESAPRNEVEETQEHAQDAYLRELEARIEKRPDSPDYYGQRGVANGVFGAFVVVSALVAWNFGEWAGFAVVAVGALLYLRMR